MTDDAKFFTAYFAIVLLVAGVIVSVLIGIIWLMVAGSRMRQAAIQSARDRYDASLQFLRANPTHPHARQACLETGRSYYSMVMPDTVTVHYQGGAMTGVSNAQNNAGSREARISADIESQIGHLRLPNVAADGGVMTIPPPQAPTTFVARANATFCGSCGKARGGDGFFCGKCGERYATA